MNKTIEAKTYHKSDCRRVFKRYDMTCARCLELANGGEARKGWNSRQADDMRRCSEIDAHFKSDKHRNGGCGVVCTFGEW